MTATRAQGAAKDTAPGAAHLPVMLAEVIDALAPRDGEVFVDGTFGGGGYARALLDAAQCSVWGIDLDPAAVANGARLAERYPGRLTVIEGSFADMDRLLAERGVDAVDGVALDLGMSSPQLDDAARGFSFRLDGPLDMRMAGTGVSAAEVVNGETEDALADIIHRYGEERRARRIAREIVLARGQSPIARTIELADIVARALGPGARRADIHPATRTFQALRIFVNDELGHLARGLAAAERLLATGGRLAVVSFHSLEDRIVKLFLRRRSGHEPGVSRHHPSAHEAGGPAPRPPSFEITRRRVRKPGKQEVAANPRARSARLRTAVRSPAGAWPFEAVA